MLVPAGATPTPVLATFTTIRSLRVESGAALSLGASILRVIADVRADGPIDATGGRAVY
ncbi:MAG: hypothetical protein IIA41_03025 [SAR324 cluster bacterium]|nr:hypothetical protein [SAR324 cluster bacterium]